MLSLRNRHRLTVGLWVILFVFAVYWARERTLTVSARGVAFGRTVVVSSSQEGLLAEVTVQLHDIVDRGQRLASLDASDLLLEQGVAAADLEAIRQGQSNALSSGGRVFERDREEAALEAARLGTEVREDEARLAALRDRLSIERQLTEQGLLPAQRVGEIASELAIVESRLEAAREALQIALESAGTSDRRAGSTVDNPWLAEVAERRLEQLEARLEKLEIDALQKGQVTWIHRRTGDYVRPGEPLMEIAPLFTDEVHAYVSAASIQGVEPGDAVRVDRPSGERIRGEVVSIGGDLRSMPSTLWRNPVAGEWGFLVRVRVPGSQLAPGEALQVVIERS